MMKHLSPTETRVIAAGIVRLKLHTVDVVPLDETATSLSHHDAIRVAVANKVVSQNRVTSSTDVYTTPLVLFDYIICNSRV